MRVREDELMQCRERGLEWTTVSNALQPSSLVEQRHGHRKSSLTFLSALEIYPATRLPTTRALRFGKYWRGSEVQRRSDSGSYLTYLRRSQPGAFTPRL